MWATVPTGSEGGKQQCAQCAPLRNLMWGGGGGGKI